MRFPSRPSSRARFAILVAGLALLGAACDHYAAASPPEAAAATAPSLTPAPTVASAAEAELEECPAVVTEAGAAVVDTLRLSDGTCVPVNVAVVYRCDPSLDPVAVLDLHGHRHRFLGGSFAVEVPALPEDARALGITALGRVFDVPEDPSWLFVESGGRYERWMALPPVGAVGSDPLVQMIGDSILDGADDALLARFPDWWFAIDAEIGRSTQGGTTVAESLAPIDADLTVIELGVNDHDPEIAAGYADRILAAAASSDGLIWVNAHGPDPDTDAVNAAISASLGRVPHAALADWANGAPPDAISSDGVHLLDGSGAPFVEFLAPLLEAWHETAIGRGADRCGAQVAEGA